MTIVYDKLWQRLNDMHMQKQELREAAGISRASMAKLAKNENVTTDVLAKVWLRPSKPHLLKTVVCPKLQTNNSPLLQIGCRGLAIAAEQGVSEAAIRKQLKRIQKHFIDIH